MNKAVFLDRDGTINVEKHYLYRIEDFVFISGAVDGMKLLQDAGYKLILITNQSGIARGYYREEDFWYLTSHMRRLLCEQGVSFARIAFCPHHPEAKVERYRIDCACRKPGLKLFLEAVRDFDIDLSQSFAIGDKLRDCALCAETLCRGYLVGSGESAETIAAVKAGKVPRVCYAGSLLESAKDICERFN